MTDRRRFGEIPTEPLFPAPRRRKGSGGETSKRQRPIGFARCPECISHARVAVLLSANHAVYRPHDYPTWSGARLPCRASAVALCQLPPRPWPSAPDNAVWSCAHA